MTTLRMCPGFDPRRIAWGRPNSPVRPFCALCSAFLPEDSVPLMLWQADGSAARFCDKCTEEMFG